MNTEPKGKRLYGGAYPWAALTLHRVSESWSPVAQSCGSSVVNCFYNLLLLHTTVLKTASVVANKVHFCYPHSIDGKLPSEEAQGRLLEREDPRELGHG